MAHVTYEIVEHDGGWAYKLGDVFSEPFRDARGGGGGGKDGGGGAALPGRRETIEYQDEEGNWHEELARGDDRPETEVQD